ncbi:hypothetical protein ACMYSP_19415 [Klebsiella sp. R390]|uniref:hypothetical protein n=1 Tax=Klebsiella sp. R390 TaxID=2755400 RepID=UPI003DA87DC8
MKNIKKLAVIIATLCSSMHVFAAENSEELAKKLNNPISNLISVPFQYDYDQDFGSNKGARNLLNIQPVMPIDFSDDAIVISRTILPVISERNTSPGSGIQTAVGDITQSFWYSPKKRTSNGYIWGLGPVLTIPSGTDLSTKSWGAGPTAILLKQEGPWTYGGLVNHVWDYAGRSNRSHTSQTLLQPFVSYTWPTATSVAMNTESTYDWRDNQWSVPVNLMVNQVLKIGDQIIQVGTGVRYWAVTDDTRGPEGWGLRMNLTFLFPGK